MATGHIRPKTSHTAYICPGPTHVWPVNWTTGHIRRLPRGGACRAPAQRRVVQCAAGPHPPPQKRTGLVWSGCPGRMTPSTNRLAPAALYRAISLELPFDGAVSFVRHFRWPPARAWHMSCTCRQIIFRLTRSAGFGSRPSWQANQCLASSPQRILLRAQASRHRR